MVRVVFPVRTMRLLGVETLIITNAAGAINTDYYKADIQDRWEAPLNEPGAWFLTATSLDDAADYLVLGEAEITLPRWIADFRAGRAAHVYPCGDEKADMARSPVPRFDLLTLDGYLHVGVQQTRGCPYNCEFCDIIELFGRVPRLKPAERMLEELEALFATGYRGHVDFVDDNFIGNKKEVKKFLPQLRRWQARHQWPFEFSTEVSINVADDEELLAMMRDAGFFAVFVGVETPDTETLEAVRKPQNLRGAPAERLRRLYAHGILVNSGYIVGFDTEPEDVAERMLALIDATLVPANLVGLLFALPGTQLTRTTHPRFIAEFGELLGLILGRKIALAKRLFQIGTNSAS